MRKRRKSNLIRIFFYGRKFRRQCVNVIDTTWCRIYFSTCENFGLSVQRSLVTQKRFVNEYFSASSSLTKLTLFWCDTKSASWALSGRCDTPTGVSTVLQKFKLNINQTFVQRPRLAVRWSNTKLWCSYGLHEFEFGLKHFQFSFSHPFAFYLPYSQLKCKKHVWEMW